MFVVGNKGEDGIMEFKRMNIIELMLKFPIAKFYLSPEDISEKCKNYMSIPSGADPGDYIRVKIKFYREKESNKTFAIFFPYSLHSVFKDKTKPAVTSNNIPKQASVLAPAKPHNGKYTKRRPRLSIEKPPISLLPMHVPSDKTVPAVPSTNIMPKQASPYALFHDPYIWKRIPRLSIDKPLRLKKPGE